MSLLSLPFSALGPASSKQQRNVVWILAPRSFFLFFILLALGCGKVQEMAKNASTSIKDAADETVKNVKDDFRSVRDKMSSAEDSKNSDSDESVPFSRPETSQASTSAKSRLESYTKIGSSRIQDANVLALANDPEAAKLVRELKFSSAPISVDSLKALSQFPNLEKLDLIRIGCLTGNMEYINAVKSLKVLDVSNNPIGNRDFFEIHGLSNLEEITITGTQITDDGFRCFKNMPKMALMRMDRMGGLEGKGFKYINRDSLKEIRANGSSIGRFAFASLAGSESLEVLWLNGAKVTDQAMIGIGRCSSLKDLHLQKNDLTNTGLQKLERLRQLESIVLSGNVRLTNQSLGSLSKIRSLKMVNVKGTQCSQNVEGEFLKLVPGCQLIF